MSNYLAIATVTMALRDILQDAALSAVPGAVVTTQRPEQVHASGQDKAGINISMYQVAPKPDWGNVDLPTRDESGKLIYRPLMGLDLHYLLSFYGSEMEMEPQRLLGNAITYLHTRPYLPLTAIQHAIESISYLAQSDLPSQSERVKFSPLNLSLEELSKLWSVFYQTPYTLSIAYQASVVLIEAPDQIPAPQTVVQPVIKVTPGGSGS
jgi:hypothetical protein